MSPSNTARPQIDSPPPTSPVPAAEAQLSQAGCATPPLEVVPSVFSRVIFQEVP